MSDHDDVLGALDLEAKKRREEVNVKAARPLPPFVRSIESTTVVYTVDPDILPFSLIDPVLLVALVNKRFHLRFKPPSYDPKTIENLGVDTSKLTDEMLIRFLLQGGRPEIRFQNGRYPTGPDSFVFIEELLFQRENIAAKVKGITEVAQLVVAEAFAILWEAADAAKRWDDKEVQDNVQLMSFETVTKIDLEQPAEGLVNAALKEHMDKSIPQQGGVGAAMLPLAAYDSFEPNPRVVASWSFDRLMLNVHTFDPSCGRHNTATIDIDTISRGDRGRGIVELTTALPFDLHVELASQIRTLLAPSADT